MRVVAHDHCPACFGVGCLQCSACGYAGARLGTVCAAGCGSVYAGGSRTCPLCPADLRAFGLAIQIAALTALWFENDELAGRMEFERNELRAQLRALTARAA